jgi:rare lipoprotein A
VVGPAAGRPLDGALPTFTAVAAWYGPGFERARTASGEAYDPAAFSAASRTLAFGTLLRVAYGNRTVTVRVNDRGPYVRGRDLDLSQAAAAALGLPGVATVTVQILPGGARRA